MSHVEDVGEGRGSGDKSAGEVIAMGLCFMGNRSWKYSTVQ